MSLQIVDRAAAGRIARYKTAHGEVTTPTLMPVINPNIDLVAPREMADLFGCEMIITNSYVIHKHDHLREHALEKGIHDLVGWDKTIMTDSGTFQMYVYGDVEVGPDEIVRFQKDMGVDVATCLDLFVTPDMTRQEAEQAVATTLERTRDAAKLLRGSAIEAEATGLEAEAAGHDPERRSHINATVQGGTHADLRQACAGAYRDLAVEYHTIGGVVPVMERQMYPELVDIILHSQQHLRKDRPVHLFGAGHPLVFPLATALGCDLYDSSSYAKYAKDGRMMTPTGTLHVSDLEEWPLSSRFLHKWTPKEWTQAMKQRKHQKRRDGAAEGGAAAQMDRIRAREQDDPAFEAERALALHNLDVCFTDLRLIRSHIRDGNLWELVEQRATAHPLLAAATRRLGDPENQAWLEAREPTSGTKALRYTGSNTHRRPIFHRIQQRMTDRFTPIGERVPAPMETPYAKEGEEKREVAMHKEPHGKPFGPAIPGPLDADQDHVVISSLGPVPLGLDEAYPFAQSMLPRLDGLDREHMGWVGTTKDAFLESHDMMPGIPGPGLPGEDVDRGFLQVLRTADWQFGRGAGLALTGASAPQEIRAWLAGNADLDAPVTPDGSFRVERSRKTEKMRTSHLHDEHVLSLRAGDALFTLKPEGARILHAALPAPANRVVVHKDSVPFNREGKSVFAQFVLDMDPDLRPGDECLVVDEADALVAVGRVMMAPSEVGDFQGGMAIKVRDGIPA